MTNIIRSTTKHFLVVLRRGTRGKGIASLALLLMTTLVTFFGILILWKMKINMNTSLKFDTTVMHDAGMIASSSSSSIASFSSLWNMLMQEGSPKIHSNKEEKGSDDEEEESLTLNHSDVTEEQPLLETMIYSSSQQMNDDGDDVSSNNDSAKHQRHLRRLTQEKNHQEEDDTNTKNHEEVDVIDSFTSISKSHHHHKETNDLVTTQHDSYLSSFTNSVDKDSSNKPPNRLLQTDGSTTTQQQQQSICSNVSDTFQTSYAIIFVGDTSLLTPEKANLVAVTFATSYNNERSGSTINNNNNNNNKCDPLFRTISEVQVITNASFTGTNNAGGGNGGLLFENSIGIIPVRRKLERQQQHRHLRDDSTLMDGILWESLLEFHRNDDDDDDDDNNNGNHGPHNNKNELYRQLQQTPQTPLTSGSNGTIANYNVGLLLLDIFGTCRGCQGNSIRFELFDDTTTSTTTQQQQGRRYLQDDSGTVDDDNDEEDCICPADAVVATDLTNFQLSFNSKIEELRDSEELDFVEEVDEIIPILETQCPTEEQDFSFVYLVTDVVFSRDIFLNLGVEGIKEIERLFEDSYNRLAQQLCDPLYRAITTTQLVSIEQEDGGSSSTVQIEFVVEATCRGDNCINVGCIFDDVESCGKNRRRRERNLKTNIGSPQHQPMSASNDGLVAAVSSIATPKILKKPPRLLSEEQDKKDDDDEERCFCRKGRSIRPPTPSEVRLAFQAGLDRITKKNKLSSCQECSFSTDCQSGVCSPAGRCAEADTQLLLNSCICGSNVECESGLCQQQQQEASSSSRGVNDGTCQGKLASCRFCNNGDECLSGFCTDGRCAESIDGKLKTGCDCISNVNCQSGRCVDIFSNIGVLGKCTEKISDTCTEPCLSSSDCNSGSCGSIACMPLNGTLLAEGCLATLTSECESGASVNNICTKRKSPAPSFQPSQEPSSTAPSGEPTTEPSREPTSEPTFTPTTSEPTAPPTSPPTPLPTTSPPTSPPTPEPTESPTSPPTLAPSVSPSTSFPSASPSTSSPTTSPSSHPTTSFPSVPPTPSPTTPSPTASPTALEDCRTFPANAYGMEDVYSFCDKHIGEECCSAGSTPCNQWSSESTYTICKGSCRDSSSCFALGDNSVGATITINKNSCVGRLACFFLGSNTEGDEITIGPDSCLNDESCLTVGQNAGGTIAIGSNSCSEEDSCYGLGDNVVGDIDIGSGSCSNVFACKGLGSDVTGDITIGTGSCTGPGSCDYFQKTASSINLGNGCDATGCPGA